MENKLILHRGYKGKYPENSKISFIKAIEKNLPFEIDIRISKDNIPIIIHEDNLEVLFDKEGKIKELDFEELKRARYKEDASQGIVSLEEFCQIVGKDYPKIFVHIKEIEDIHETVKIFRRYGIIKNINFFACYQPTLELIEVIKKLYPEYKVGLSLVENSPYYDKKYFLMSDFIWADEVNFRWIDKEKIDFSHKLNRKIYCPSPDLVIGSVFKNNVKERWKELILDGVDGIFTDLPDEFKDFCDKLNMEKECIFCNRKKIKEDILYETENFYVKLGFGIAASGHLLIISKKHYNCLAEIPEYLYKEYLALCKKTEAVIKQEFGEGFFLDFGPGGQSLNHQHTHYIPLKSSEYKIEDLIKEAIIPTGMKFEKGDLYHLKRIYESGEDYIWLGVNGEYYVYHIMGKYNREKHFNWRYFLSKIKGVKSIPLSWREITPDLEIIDEEKRRLTKIKLKPYFNSQCFYP